MKSMLDRDFWKLENLRQTWEYKTFSFLARAVLALIVVLYLLFALPSIYPWAQREWARMQPPEHFEVLLDKASKTGDFEYTLRWLNFRRIEESPYFSEIITKRSGELPALFFGYNARHFTKEKQQDEMLFWMLYTRYRLRYDILRCGNPEMVEKISQLFSLLSKLQGIDNSEFEKLQSDLPRLKKSIQRVSDFDAQQPARNDPRTTCKIFASFSDFKTAPTPPEDWAPIRHTLRIVTENSLKKMDTPAP